MQWGAYTGGIKASEQAFPGPLGMESMFNFHPPMDTGSASRPPISLPPPVPNEALLGLQWIWGSLAGHRLRVPPSSTAATQQRLLEYKITHDYTKEQTIRH